MGAPAAEIVGLISAFHRSLTDEGRPVRRLGKSLELQPRRASRVRTRR
jgi:hypothetical protein